MQELLSQLSNPDLMERDEEERNLLDGDSVSTRSTMSGLGVSGFSAGSSKYQGFGSSVKQPPVMEKVTTVTFC